jgi:hypothetical protein
VGWGGGGHACLYSAGGSVLRRISRRQLNTRPALHNVLLSRPSILHLVGFLKKLAKLLLNAQVRGREFTEPTVLTVPAVHLIYIYSRDSQLTWYHAAFSIEKSRSEVKFRLSVFAAFIADSL